MEARRALLGLGSNLGDRLATLRSAVSGLAEVAGVDVTGCSSVYASPPMGPVAQGEFLNAAVAVETELAPRELLSACLAVEAAHGRERRERWGPRTLDIDVLWMEGVRLAEAGLSIPHPGLAERAFVLRPLAELAPELRLPDGRTAAAAVEELVDDACVRIPGARLRG
ncbi:MAG: 2-amino-4-hydroxy-6-hydroxymethyldihydropteridine diphosphokinase [Armatimonadetes bacterium]|nr:2-amino-4-hydroxy-6-hydroxymethyldihydropteridine diphosphokinase [Armatimonadota bacterium]